MYVYVYRTVKNPNYVAPKVASGLSLTGRDYTKKRHRASAFSPSMHDEYVTCGEPACIGSICWKCAGGIEAFKQYHSKLSCERILRLSSVETRNNHSHMYIPLTKAERRVVSHANSKLSKRNRTLRDDDVPLIRLMMDQKVNVYI